MQQLSFDHYTLENAQIAFKLKHRFTGDTFNLLYVVICDPCKNENIAKIEERKIKLRDGARVYRQHIWQPQYQKLEVEEHLRVCGNGEFWTFSLLQILSQNTELR